MSTSLYTRESVTPSSHRSTNIINDIMQVGVGAASSIAPILNVRHFVEGIHIH